MNSFLYNFLRWCPGALGLWLRQKLLPRIFSKCGKGILFGRFVHFVAPDKIQLGDRVVLNNHVILDGGQWSLDTPALILEDDVFIGTGTELHSGKNGPITIQSGTNFSSFCTIVSSMPLIVKKNCLWAAYSVLGKDYVGEKTTRSPVRKKTEKNKKTVIGDGSWLGVRMQIEEGITIGNDTIVGAHSLVNTDLPPYAIAIGQPAEVMKYRRPE